LGLVLGLYKLKTELLRHNQQQIETMGIESEFKHILFFLGPARLIAARRVVTTRKGGAERRGTTTENHNV
jgi:hypothetical protein